MSTDSCLFVVHSNAPLDRADLDRRIRALTRWYAPLHLDVVDVRDVGPTCLAGRLGSREQEPLALACWGGRSRWKDADAALTASAGAIAAKKPRGVTIATDDRRARMISQVLGPTALYEAAGDRVTAWSTHAVAAALLTHGAVDIDRGSVLELLACEFVGGTRTLATGVTAVPAGLIVDVEGGDARRTPYSTLGDRWEPVPEGTARDEAWTSLLASLEEETRGREVELGLSGGLDSAVVAVALKELGTAFTAFTWTFLGEQSQAAALAQRLGIRHESREAPVRESDHGMADIDTEVRWTEGLAPLTAFGGPPVTESEIAWLTGGAGEIGRAFYYRGRVLPDDPPPDRLGLSRLVDFSWSLPGLDGDRADRLRGAVTSWIDDATRTGPAGWRVLDIVYGEQRFTRWGRSMVPRTAADLVPAFGEPNVAAAFASLPLEDRLTDGFHRWVLENAGLHGVVSAGTESFPRGSAVVRKLNAWRHRRGALRASDPFATHELWSGHEAYRAWLFDRVLPSELIHEALGESAAARLRRDAAAGRAVAWRAALRATGPVALRDALADAARDAPAR